MRIPLLTALALSAFLAAACGSGAAPPAPGSTAAPARPQLSVGVLFPLAVRGSGFRGRERVTVTLAAERTHRRTVVADRSGRFVAHFEVRLPRCGSVLLRAKGSQGSSASRELPRPDCRDP